MNINEIVANVRGVVVLLVMNIQESTRLLRFVSKFLLDGMIEFT